MPPPHSPRGAGFGYALAAYLAWGLLPLYFRALAGVPPLEILAHRILWSVAFLAGLVGVMGRWEETVSPLRSPRGRLVLLATTVLIASNWLIYIWAVHAGRVLEASLGYFINPLVNVLLGVAFLREPLSRRQLLAVLLAAAGVAALVVRVGGPPWVALALAGSFGTYGLLRKVGRIDAVGGLLAETGLLAPLAALWMLHLHRSGQGHFGDDFRQSALLAAAGVITALPLIWFAVGVQRLRLSTIGLLQYVAPSLQFAVAVFVFREPFGAAHGVAFACIWTSLALYSADVLARTRRVEAGGSAAPSPASAPPSGASP